MLKLHAAQRQLTLMLPRDVKSFYNHFKTQTVRVFDIKHLRKLSDG